MGEVTSSGMTPTALAVMVFSMVTVCTIIVVAIGVLIDRTAAHHERGKGKY
jgi:hypothetical protein